MKHRIINMWSGPRNLSTALMYSWRSRADTTVWDEPMYGHFLAATGVDHPGRDEVLAATLTSEPDIVAEMLRDDSPTPIRFYKNMAHHLVGFDLAIIDSVENFLLTRDPAEMLPSLARGLGRVPTIRDTGLEEQVQIVERILATDRDPLIVDSRTLLEDPQSVLRALCAALAVDWDPAMLSWPEGPKPEDGMWARHWYSRLHATTGFEPYRPRSAPLDPALETVHEQAAPLYERLAPYSITA